MLNRIFTTLKVFGAGMLLAASLVYGQAGKTIVVQVPFDFIAGHQQMPAGEYTVTVDTSQSTVLLRNYAEGEALFVITYSEQAKRIPQRGMLVFTRYGEHHFLAQVWPAGMMYGPSIIPQNNRPKVRPIRKLTL